MARQELSNVFSDGLLTDLNPINTPKSVLTDCLNGTYITYNGNEFVLQNDMGNYKLKNCKLPTNFIPVGVKGYADILYIVSYNPITNETEIGSYPAPQSLFTTGDSDQVLATNDDLAPFIWTGEAEYPTIIKDYKKPVFVFTNSDEELYKLNPGDEFKFEGTLDTLNYIYQHLNFYIIDEDNKLYDIDDTQIYDEYNNLVTTEMRKVFWETPGWLAAQYDLYVPDRFNLNLKSLNVPEFLVASEDDETSTQASGDLDTKEPDSNQFKVSMDLSAQIIITDRLFQTELENNYGHVLANIYDHLFIRYLVKTKSTVFPDEDYGSFQGFVVYGAPEDYTSGTSVNKDGESYVLFDLPVWKHNYQDDIVTAYDSIKSIWFCNNPEEDSEGNLDIANYHGVVELTAYPIIKYGDNTLEFTQFSTTQRFPLNTLKNSSDITISDSIYKWSVDDDSCTISFNINGPFVNASGITGKYEIYRINWFNYFGDEKAAEEEAGKPLEESAGTNNSPISASSYDMTQTEADVLVKDAKNKWTRETQTLTADTFAKAKVLMCENTIPNLVLYGQNTINIDWANSNEFQLTNYKNYYTNPNYDSEDEKCPKAIEDKLYIDHNTGTKTINFSKEGGIYLFRVVLEQDGKYLADSQKVLIPSVVFNDFFGSADNYLTDITSAAWVGKWMDYISQPLLINNLQVDFTTEEEITPETTWDEFVLEYNLKKAPVKLAYKKNDDSSDSEEIDWEQTIVDGMQETAGRTHQWLTSPATFRYRINTAQLKPVITLRDGIISINKLEGNLWNPVLLGDTVLKTNLNEEIVKINIDESVSFAKEILIPWNLLSSNAIETYPKQSDDIYVFDIPRNVSGNYIYPKITVDGEQCGSGNRGERTSVRANYNIEWGTTDYEKYNTTIEITKENEYTDCNNQAFGVIGRALSNAGAAWGTYNITLGDKVSKNSQVYLYRDSDDNRDKGKIGVVGTPYEGIQMFATGGTSNLSDKTIALYFQNEQTKHQFVWALMHIVATNNSNTPTTVYYPTFGLDSIIENENVTLTKYTTSLTLAYLRFDDLILNTELSDLQEYSETLLSTPVININKTINNSMSNLIVNLNYIDNVKYYTFIQGIITGMQSFNDSQSAEMNIANTAVKGSSLKAVEEAAPHSSALPSEFNDGKFGNSDDAIAAANRIISKLEKKDMRYGYSPSNIGFHNELLNTLKYINGTRGSNGENTTNNSASIMLCYNEDFSF